MNQFIIGRQDDVVAQLRATFHDVIVSVVRRVEGQVGQSLDARTLLWLHKVQSREASVNEAQEEYQAVSICVVLSNSKVASQFQYQLGRPTYVPIYGKDYSDDQLESDQFDTKQSDSSVDFRE